MIMAAVRKDCGFFVSILIVGEGHRPSRIPRLSSWILTRPYNICANME